MHDNTHNHHACPTDMKAHCDLAGKQADLELET